MNIYYVYFSVDIPENKLAHSCWLSKTKSFMVGLVSPATWYADTKDSKSSDA